MTSLLITGATRGLGLHTARAAAERGAEVTVAGRSRAAVERVAGEVGGRPLLLDLASLASVREAVEAAGRPDVVVCNAGLQITQGATRTVDGFDETFQVNVLSHVALVDGLLAKEKGPGRVVWLGSATHDPGQRTGLPAPSEGGVEQVAAPAEDPAGQSAMEGRRRYATSKLLCTALAGAYARDQPGLHSLCFDPGLMPGTGLARDHAGWQRALWSTAFRALRVLPFASSPERSGGALAALALDRPAPASSGDVVDFRGRQVSPSARASDPGFQDDVLRGCRSLLADPAGLPAVR